MNNFQKFETGKSIESFMGHAEGVSFGFNEAGAIMIIFFDNPTPDEIDQFKSGKRFEMRMIVLSGIIMITVKIGDLNWMDSPYTPHSNKDKAVFKDIIDGTGYALTLMLVNGQNGKIEHLRMIGMSEKFSRSFKKIAEDNLSNDFDINTYNLNLNLILSKYQTKDIVKMSTDYFKIS